MPFTLTLSEPKSAKYIYIDADGHLHLLLPLVGGQTIGLDNTCKTAIELQVFFYGQTKSPEDKSPSALDVLTHYISALRQDIPICSIINNEPLLRAKEMRLREALKYQSLLKQVIKQRAIHNCLNPMREYPQLPEVISLILANKNNCLSIRLSPEKPDFALRLSSPVFSVNRRGLAPSQNYYIDVPDFGAGLRNSQATIKLKIKTHKQTIIDAAQAHFETYDFSELKQFLHNKILEQFNQDIDFSTITEEYLRTNGLYDDDATVADHVENILNARLDSTFWDQLNPSLFNDLSAENRSIKIQFFLAQINLYCYANGISKRNFGSYFDSNPLKDIAIQNVKKALIDGTRVEDCLFNIVNNYWLSLGMNRRLKDADKQVILTHFKDQFETIQHSKHFDEFLVFQPGKPGDFVVHDGRISLSFTQFAERQLDNDHTLETRIALNQLKLNGPSFHKQQGQRLLAINPAVAKNHCLNQNQLPAISSLQTNTIHLADILLLRSMTGQYYFECLPDYCITYIETHTEWQRLLNVMSSKIDDTELQKLILFSTRTEQLESLVKADKISHLPKELETNLVSNHMDFFNEALTELINNYMTSRSFLKKLFGTSRKKEIQQINELRLKADDNISAIKAKLAKLDDLENNIRSEFRWFWRSSNLKDLLTPCIGALQTRLRLLEQQYASITTTTIIAQQNSVLQNEASPLHALNHHWWLPENKSYLTELIKLTHLSSREAVIFFNKIEPKQLDTALIKGLTLSPPSFSTDININTLRTIGQAQLTEYAQQPVTAVNQRTDEGLEPELGRLTRMINELCGINKNVLARIVNYSPAQNSFLKGAASYLTPETMRNRCEKLKIAQTALSSLTKDIPICLARIAAYTTHLQETGNNIDPHHDQVNACFCQISNSMITYEKYPALIESLSILKTAFLTAGFSVTEQAQGQPSKRFWF